MRSKTLRIGSAPALLPPAMLGLALLSGCGGGGGAPSAEVQQQNIQDELAAEQGGPTEDMNAPVIVGE